MHAIGCGFSPPFFLLLLCFRCLPVESMSSSALCARLRRQLTDRNGLKNRVVTGGVDSKSFEWQVKTRCVQALGHVGSHCFPSSIAQHLQVNIFIGAVRQWNLLCRVQYKWRRLVNREPFMVAGGGPWLPPLPRSPRPDINGQDAGQLLPTRFCSAEQLLQQQSESAAGRVCGKSHKESFQFCFAPL